MFLRAKHRTVFEYPTPAAESHNEVRLMPLSDESQTLIGFKLQVQPHAKVFAYEAPGGMVHNFGVLEPHLRIEILATAEVETLRDNPMSGLNLLDPDWNFYEAERTYQNNVEYLSASPYVPLWPDAARLADRLRRPQQSAASYLLGLNRHLHETLEYDVSATNVYSTLEEVMAKRAGVCQDFAHMMIACCRSQGIPTRYVSGYLYGGLGIRGEQATHAWVECLMPDGRWLGLDPTNNLLANDRHVKIHVGRDYSEVSPTRGVYIGPPASLLAVTVEVEEIVPTPLHAVVSDEALAGRSPTAAKYARGA